MELLQAGLGFGAGVSLTAIAWTVRSSAPRRNRLLLACGTEVLLAALVLLAGLGVLEEAADCDGFGCYSALPADTTAALFFDVGVGLAVAGLLTFGLALAAGFGGGRSG